MIRFAWAAIAALGLAVGCGPNTSGDDTQDETNASLVVSPPTSVHTLLNGATDTQPYTAALVFPDGTERDVTAETTFSVELGIGNFDASTLNIFGPGKGTVVGTRSDKVGSAQILVNLKSTRVEPPLDPSVVDLFDGAENAARAPTVVYPANDVIMPRNLGDFEIHWTDGNGNDVFELSLVTEFTDVRIYVSGGNGQIEAGPMPSWHAFKASEWLAAVGFEKSIQYKVRGVQQGNPAAGVGAAPPRLVKLTNENMEGGLYYWGAKNNPQPTDVYGIFRHDMSKPGEPAEGYLTTENVKKANGEGRCVACHVMSRDGTKMGITYDGGNEEATLVDVATKTQMPDTLAKWNFGTFTPDNKKLLATYDGKLTVRDAETLAPIVDMPAASRVSHPDLSPDGTKLVYVRANGNFADWMFTRGTIYTRTFDPTTNAFGAETPLVVDANNNFYPSWSPDGQWILFNRATPTNISDGRDDAYDNPDASLWVIKADGSAPAVELGITNQALGLTNAWGRWAPFAQSLGGNTEPLMWITVSSKRDFGVRLFGSARRPQIWMAPFFPGRTGDPSAPAFRLPFQNITTNNHIAQWTEKIVTPQ